MARAHDALVAAMNAIKAWTLVDDLMSRSSGTEYQMQEIAGALAAAETASNNALTVGYLFVGRPHRRTDDYGSGHWLKAGKNDKG